MNKKLDKMKYIKLLLMLAVISISFSACYEEEDWLEENIKEGGKYYPQTPIFKSTSDANQFYFGEEIPFEMNYWSRDEVATTYLFMKYDDVDEEVQNKPQSSSSVTEDGRMDKMLFSYTAKELPTKSTLGFYGKAKTIYDLEKSTSTVGDIYVCPKDLKGLYNSNVTGKGEIYIFDFETGEVFDTIKVDTTMTSNVTFIRNSDESYSVDDLSFGFFNGSEDSVTLPGDITRDICHFGGETTELIGEQNIAGIVNYTGLVYSDKEMSFDWSMEFVYADTLVIGFLSGTSLLTE